MARRFTMSPWEDFRSNIGKYTNVFYRLIVIQSLNIGGVIFLCLLPSKYSFKLFTIFEWLSLFLGLYLLFLISHSLYKITKLYEEVASLLLDPTSFQFYGLYRSLEQDSKKQKQITIEKALMTMNLSKSVEFIKKYHRFNKAKKARENGYIVYMIVYFISRTFLSTVINSKFIWSLLLVLPIALYASFPFYFDAFLIVRNGRKLGIAMLSYSLQKVIKHIDS